MNIVVQGIDISKARNVLLVCPGDLDENDLLQLKALLNDKFPDVYFLILSGDFQAVTSDDTKPQILKVNQ